MEGTSRAAALNKGKDRVLVAAAALDLKALFAADEGFIDLDNAASSAHGRKRAGAHRLADAMGRGTKRFSCCNRSMR